MPRLSKSTFQGVPSLPLLDFKLFTTTSTGFSLSFCSNPMICPTKPPGFGTGHSRCLLRSPSSSTTAVDCGCSMPAVVFGVSASLRLRLRRPFPSSVSPLSANFRRSTGQGSTCGKPTTRKQTASVAVKSVPVARERGCMWCISAGVCHHQSHLIDAGVELKNR